MGAAYVWIVILWLLAFLALLTIAWKITDLITGGYLTTADTNTLSNLYEKDSIKGVDKETILLSRLNAILSHCPEILLQNEQKENNNNTENTAIKLLEASLQGAKLNSLEQQEFIEKFRIIAKNKIELQEKLFNIQKNILLQSVLSKKNKIIKTTEEEEEEKKNKDNRDVSIIEISNIIIGENSINDSKNNNINTNNHRIEEYYSVLELYLSSLKKSSFQWQISDADTNTYI